MIRKSSGQLGLRIAGRLKPSVSLEQAQAEMNVLNQWRIEELTRTNRDPQWSRSKTEVVSAGPGFSRLRDQYGTALFAMMALAGLQLLMACTNMASMLLSRAAARQSELALRISLGASQFRLARQVLTESLILSTTGALAGILLASWGTAALVGILSSGRDRIEIQIPLDWHVLLFAAGSAVVTAVVFGLAPAFYASQLSPLSRLKE
jgi:ABC-type antimicrobial peptide transport system permease subunit